MAPNTQNGFFVSWEQVMAFFAMAEEALKAKTAANEVKSRIYTLPRSCPIRVRDDCLTVLLPALQELSGEAAAVKEELEEKRVAYIKVAFATDLFQQHACSCSFVLAAKRLLGRSLIAASIVLPQRLGRAGVACPL